MFTINHSAEDLQNKSVKCQKEVPLCYVYITVSKLKHFSICSSDVKLYMVTVAGLPTFVDNKGAFVI